jgi:hypothetical protein
MVTLELRGGVARLASRATRSSAPGGRREARAPEVARNGWTRQLATRRERGSSDLGAPAPAAEVDRGAGDRD